MQNGKRLGFALMVLALGSQWAWAQPGPSLKELLTLDTQRGRQEKKAPTTTRLMARPHMLAIYGPSGQRSVLVRLGTTRLLFQEGQPSSLPMSSYQLLGIDQHCARFRRPGSKATYQTCLSLVGDSLVQAVTPKEPQMSVAPQPLPWPRKESP